MAQDLTKLVVKTVNENNLPKKRRPSKKMKTTDMVYIPSAEDFAGMDHKAKIKGITDFAIMNHLAVRKLPFIDSGLGEYFLRNSSFYSENCCLRMEEGGFVSECLSDHDSMGTVPTLKIDAQKFVELSSSLPNGVQVEQVPNVAGKGTSHIIKLGEYPQTKVDTDMSIMLEGLFNNGKLQEGLVATGRWFTTNGTCIGFEAKQNPEFEYNGEKYVRVITRSSGVYSYSDGETTKGAVVEWVKVEPISFVVKNWERLPKSINPKGKGKDKFLVLESEKIIIGGIPFYRDSYSQNVSLWQNSLIRAFLNSSNNVDLGRNDAYSTSNGYGDKWDFSKSGFLYEAFNLDREPIKEYTIPRHESTVTRFAFAGCVNLEKVIIPSHVSSIDKTAFDDCNFEYVYFQRVGGHLVFAKNMPKNLSECVCITNLKKLQKVINFENYSVLLSLNDLSKLGKLAEILEKNKIIINQSTAEELIDNIRFDEFIKNGDFRFFNNELKPYLTELNNYSLADVEMGFYKFAVLLGCFSTQKIVDKHGKETQVIMAQKASTIMAQMIKSGMVKLDQFISLVENVPLVFEPSQDFLKFISQQGEKGKFANLEMLLTLEQGYPGMFVKVMTEFEKVKTFRTTLGPDGTPVNVPWADALINFYGQSAYYGVTSEDQDIAEVFSRHGLKQEIFVEAVDLRNEAKRKNVPSHILGEELKEDTILDSIEKIKSSTEIQLQDSKTLIEDLYSKRFTYEMLDKYDPRNAIMGIYTSCCGTITSAFYGSDIARATMREDDVQNLVVKNYNGEIVAKGTMYLNREKGYIVINDFELSAVYKHDEIGIGFYDVKKDSSEEQDREMIFNAFMRGIYAFIAKYDAKNPENPINYVTVGLGHNRLQEQCSKFSDATKTFAVPSEYEFCDAKDSQKILYNRKKHLNRIHQGGGKEQ